MQQISRPNCQRSLTATELGRPRLRPVAVRCFTMEDDASDDRGAGGYEDDDEVVGAVEAVLEGE